MFKNAYEGIKKIFTAEIIMLIASIVTFVGAIVTITADSNAVKDALNNPNEASITAGVAILGIVAIAFGICALVAFILNLVGLVKARKDDANFNTALMLTIAGIVVSILSSILSKNENVVSFLNTGVELAYLLATMFIVYGIVSLAKQLKNTPVETKGNRLLKIIVIVQGIGIGARLLGAIFTVAKLNPVIPGIIGIIAAILTVVYHLIYISLLSDAKKMLAK
ncbi:MAG: hypothetical protein IKI64_07675 [Clostridia bacterium]|nr:hypothetical protein [Clostridia bacterium]